MTLHHTVPIPPSRLNQVHQEHTRLFKWALLRIQKNLLEHPTYIIDAQAFSVLKNTAEYMSRRSWTSETGQGSLRELFKNLYAIEFVSTDDFKELLNWTSFVSDGMGALGQGFELSGNHLSEEVSLRQTPEHLMSVVRSPCGSNWSPLNYIALTQLDVMALDYSNGIHDLLVSSLFSALKKVITKYAIYGNFHHLSSELIVQNEAHIAEVIDFTLTVGANYQNVNNVDPDWSRRFHSFAVKAMSYCHSTNRSIQGLDMTELWELHQEHNVINEDQLPLSVMVPMVYDAQKVSHLRGTPEPQWHELIALPWKQ